MILPAPMLLNQGTRTPPFGQSGWIYELKFDGYRLIAGIEGGQVQLATKRGANATRWFPEVVQGLAQLAGGPHILDGEVCVIDELGRSDFNRLQDRARRRCFYPGCDPVVFCAFDLLARDGRSLIGLPVETRKQQLGELLSPPPPSVLYVGHFDAEHGRVLFDQAVHQLNLEGLVAKRLGSPYRPGVRSPDWVKVKRAGAVLPERFKR
jgi:bifunctional non-homologous end joining protein LigD